MDKPSIEQKIHGAVDYSSGIRKSENMILTLLGMTADRHR